MKYRKKPVIVEAEVYKPGLEDGCDFYDVSGKFIVMMARVDMERKGCPRAERKPFIMTLEGKIYISEGDYIITGVKGERYPCKPDIFAATYELVEQS